MPGGFLDHCQKTLLPGFRELLSSREGDLDIQCKDGVLQTFRLILVACSPMLEQAFRDQEDLIDGLIAPDFTLRELELFHHWVLEGVSSSSAQPPDQTAILSLFGHLGINLDEYCGDKKPKFKEPAKSVSSVGVGRVIYECPTCQKEYLNEQSYSKHVSGHKKVQLPVSSPAPNNNKENESSKPSEMDKDQQSPSGIGRRPKRSLSKPKRFQEDGGSESGMYQCFSCEEVFESPELRDLHGQDHVKMVPSAKRSYYGKKSRFVCGECQRPFSSKQALENHSRLHKGERKYSCETCGKSFVSLGALSTHKRLHDGSAASFPCQHCDKSFNNTSNLMRHIRAMHFEHSDGKCFECPECRKVFKDPSGLSAHVKIHEGVRDHACEDCEKRFVTSAQLRVHQRIHKGQRPYSCDLCGRTFVTNGQLKSHVQYKHIGVKLPKSNLCNTCGAAFVKSFDLKVHMLKHTGELPFACEHCGKGFRSKRHVLDHARTHTGEKPYKCNTCQRSFRAPGGLRQHFKVHEKCRVNSANQGAYSLKRVPESGAPPHLLLASKSADDLTQEAEDRLAEQDHYEVIDQAVDEDDDEEAADQPQAVIFVNQDGQPITTLDPGEAEGIEEHGSNYITISRDAAGSFVTSDGMTLVEVPTTITTEELLITQEGATDNSSETVALLHAPSLGGEPST